MEVVILFSHLSCTINVLPIFFLSFFFSCSCHVNLPIPLTIIIIIYPSRHLPTKLNRIMNLVDIGMRIRGGSRRATAIAIFTKVVLPIITTAHFSPGPHALPSFSAVLFLLPFLFIGRKPLETLITDIRTGGEGSGVGFPIPVPAHGARLPCLPPTALPKVLHLLRHPDPGIHAIMLQVQKEERRGGGEGEVCLPHDPTVSVPPPSSVQIEVCLPHPDGGLVFLKKLQCAARQNVYKCIYIAAKARHMPCHFHCHYFHMSLLLL